MNTFTGIYIYTCTLTRSYNCSCLKKQTNKKFKVAQWITPVLLLLPEYRY